MRKRGILTLITVQLTQYESLATPANWKNGEACVILPSVSNEQAEKMFPKGFVEVKPIYV